MKTEQMTTDELLSAYLDGELPQNQADAVTERLASEPELMHRLEELSGADGNMRELMDAVDKTPLPDAVQRLLNLAESQKDEPATNDNVVPLRPRNAAAFLQMPAALAAGVTLVVGFLVGNVVSSPAPQGLSVNTLSSGNIAADSQLHAVLNENPSGAEKILDGDVRATVVLSLQSPDGSYCRQLRVDSETASGHALACLRDSGWQLNTVAYTPAPSGAFTPASTTVPPALDAAVDKLLGDGEALSEDRESDLISKGWN